MDKWKEIFDNLTAEMTDDEVVVADVLSDIAVEIVKYRIEHGLDQKDMANLLHVSQPMISKYESGTYNFTIKSLFVIANKLGLNVDFNINGNNQLKCDNRSSIISSKVKNSKYRYDFLLNNKQNKNIAIYSNSVA